MNRLISVGLIGGLALFLSACGSNEDPGSGTPVRVSATIAAVVNGEPILAAEVDVEAAAQGKIDVGDQLEFDDPIFGEILDQLIDQKLLAQEALVRGLDQGESAQHRLLTARERILGNILVENLVAQEVDEAAILEMYEAQTALQQLGEEVLIRHIAVDTEEEANELYQELRGGAEFAELAFAHSIDRNTNAEGGLIGYVLPEEFPGPFARAINNTAVGAFSRPFEGDLGWHIIKVDDRRTEEPPTFDEVRPTIIQFLTLNQISRVLTSLRERANIATITEGRDLQAVLDPPEVDEILDDEEEPAEVEEMVGDPADEAAADEAATDGTEEETTE